MWALRRLKDREMSSCWVSPKASPEPTRQPKFQAGGRASFGKKQPKDGQEQPGGLRGTALSSSEAARGAAGPSPHSLSLQAAPGRGPDGLPNARHGECLQDTHIRGSVLSLAKLPPPKTISGRFYSLLSTTATNTTTTTTIFQTSVE